MSDTNKWIVVGRLTKDSELGTSVSGSSYLRFSIATNRSIKEGEVWKDETSFFDFTLFGGRTKLTEFLKKGTMVLIESQVRLEHWEKDGEKRQKIGFVVDNIQLLGGNKKSAQESSPADDIPF